MKHMCQTTGTCGSASGVVPSRARDVSLRKTPGWEQRIDLGGAGGEEVNEKNTSVCDRRKYGQGQTGERGGKDT